MQSLSFLFSHSPSFNRTCSSSSNNNKSTGRFLLQDAFIQDDADRLVSSNTQQQQQHCNDDSEDEFEFAFASVLSPVPADQIFYNGQIRVRPFYPHFNVENKSVVSCMIPRAARLPLRKLLVEERELDNSASSCSSSVTDELERVEVGTYCIWDLNTADDSREPCKKSMRRPKLRDFLQKSNSSGTNSFAFVKFS
ncbi:hypothetical protein POM88_044165 [Heracleum sosnowskyi]|uniref:Uncharacterized protein n=1 Tax=Heracleum sosnowskyi TaxID=360622 RepID=A0AAD8H399_9APIA|nr:hypothetical protein POM88_044165 [Heracleum sosnowskyi]